MSKWCESRLIDVFTSIDISLLEADGVENDLSQIDLRESQKEKKTKKRIAVITGIAAGSVAITGAVILLFKKGSWMKKAA